MFLGKELPILPIFPSKLMAYTDLTKEIFRSIVKYEDLQNTFN